MVFGQSPFILTKTKKEIKNGFKIRPIIEYDLLII